MTEYNDIDSNFEFFDEESEQDYHSFTPSLSDLQNDHADYSDEDSEFYDFAEADKVEYDDLFSDIDFSDYSGKFKPNLRRTISKSRSKPIRRRSLKKRPTKSRSRGRKKDIPVRNYAHIKNKAKSAEKVLVPNDRKVIIEGVNSFMLDNSEAASNFKNFGYLNGKKLKTMVIIFNNDTLNDFTIELFNPSMPLDYLHSTSLNINDKVKVAGGTTSYTDLLFNILANPLQIYQAKYAVAGPSQLAQINQPLIIKNKNVEGIQQVQPFQMQLNVDIDQNQNDIFL